MRVIYRLSDLIDEGKIDIPAAQPGDWEACSFYLVVLEDSLQD